MVKETASRPRERGNVRRDTGRARVPPAILVLLLVAHLPLWAGEGAADKDLLLMRNGAVVLAHTGQYDKKYPASALIDGVVEEYWASSKRHIRGFRPDRFILELDRPYRIRRLVVDNHQNDEMEYPGVSAKEVRFSASTESRTGPWTPVAVVTGKRWDRSEVVLEKPVGARWLKVEVLSNHGHERYTEISELEAYGDPLEDEPVRDVDPNGVYQTNYGPLYLKVDGNRVEGCYELDKGYVHGTTNGRVFEVEWIEHRGEERGTAILVLASTAFLNGLWYEDGQMMGPWFGNKLPEGETIDCDPLTAAAGVGFNAGQVVEK